MKIELLDTGFLLIPTDGDGSQYELINGEKYREIECWRAHYGMDEVLRNSIEIVSRMTATDQENVYVTKSTYENMECYRFHVHGIRTQR